MIPSELLDLHFYKNDETLFQRHEKALPPIEAYLFFPNEFDIIEENLKKPNKTLRRIFESNEKFNQYEETKYAEMLEEINNKKNSSKIVIPEDWNKFELRRFLQATGFQPTKSIELLARHFEWRGNFFPLKITNKTLELLNCGFIYIHGRDNHYRPIMVLNARKYVAMKDKFAYEDWLTCIIFFMEYVIHNLLIPGQVENWNIITDVTDVSMIFLPNELKKLISVLQSNYRCRLFINYIIGMGGGLQLLWKCIQPFLDKTTIRKVRILTNATMSEIFTYINEEQVEQKFGGKANNVELGVANCLFPPIMPSLNFLKSDDDRDKILLTEEKYKAMYLEGQVKHVHEHFLLRWEEERKRLVANDKVSMELIETNQKEQEETKPNENYTRKLSELNLDNESLDVVLEMDRNNKSQFNSKIVPSSLSDIQIRNKSKFFR